MAYANRVDSNQKTIVKNLLGIGASVQPLNRVKDGCPDILVGFRGENYLLEIKTDKGSLTDDEEEFFRRWRGQRAVVRSFEEACRVIGAL